MAAIHHQLTTLKSNVGLGVAVALSGPAAVVYSAFEVTFTFSESVSDFVIGDITVTNGAASGFSGSGTTYTATITPTAPGNVTVQVAAGVATGDTSGQGNLESTLIVEFRDEEGQPLGLLLALTKS